MKMKFFMQRLKYLMRMGTTLFLNLILSNAFLITCDVSFTIRLVSGMALVYSTKKYPKYCHHEFCLTLE